MQSHLQVLGGKGFCSNGGWEQGWAVSSLSRWTPSLGKEAGESGMSRSHTQEEAAHSSLSTRLRADSCARHLSPRAMAAS